MSNVLMGYLNKRLKEQNSPKKGNSTTAGPVITISREVGCNGLKLANLMVAHLKNRKQKSIWQVLSKEIFHQSAMELNMKSEDVRRVFKQSEKYAFDEILKAFNNKNYKSEQKIVKTLIDVVRSSAIDGNCIIVGRAGHIIASDIENSIHIRLVAPLEYRVKTIMENNDLNREDSIQFIKKIERERIAFRKAIKIKNIDEELFDLTINRASFSNENIIDIIEFILEKKGLLLDDKPKGKYY
ncbi:MAG: cytidylate kinase-like family protein [Draconibacterium sp.]|nr:cytidylate kinase-like family protein [Draconibacterium sp.]